MAALRSAARRAPAADPIAADVRASLLQPMPSLPSKYFYDQRGSQLFDAITRLPEYYLTRTEEALLRAHCDEILSALKPDELVELGSADAGKIRILLEALRRARLGSRCVMFDINGEALAQAVRGLQADYRELEFVGVAGDFLKDLALLGPARASRRLVLFLGSTLGNLPPDELPAFLASVSHLLRPGDGFLLGLDLVKDPARLVAAYNDSQGVTAEFNRNILRVVNARLGADFDPQGFEHVAFYDVEHAWIEMRLRAMRPMRVRVPGAGLVLNLERDFSLRTELSCKFTRESLTQSLAGTALRVSAWFSDPDELFALALLERLPWRPAAP